MNYQISEVFETSEIFCKNIMKPRKHPYILQYPFSTSVQGAKILSYREENHGKRLDVVLEFDTIERLSSELFLQAGKVFERAKVKFSPVQLHFYGISDLKNGDFFLQLNKGYSDNTALNLIDLLSWIQPYHRHPFYLLWVKSADAPDLSFFASRVTCESLHREITETVIERDWCPSPPMTQGSVPRPKGILTRFGGDPVTVEIDSRPQRLRLFVGGVYDQAESRPEGIDIVLNVGEDPSRWVKDGKLHPADRWDEKGEGSKSMSVDELRAVAKWVAGHLRAGKRVLVHCSAGMNRSTTICCAALIVLEGLSAEAALARVREHHPWAKPDSVHWLKLHWLADHL